MTILLKTLRLLLSKPVAYLAGGMLLSMVLSGRDDGMVVVIIRGIMMSLTVYAACRINKEIMRH